MKHIVPLVLVCSLTGALLARPAWADERDGRPSKDARFEHRNGPHRFGYGYERRQAAGEIPRHFQHSRNPNHDQR